MVTKCVSTIIILVKVGHCKVQDNTCDGKKCTAN